MQTQFIDTCELDAGGHPYTLPEVEQWVAKTAARLIAECHAPFKARIWPYRQGAVTCISCDIDGRTAGESFTFQAVGRHDFDHDSPYVPDVAEALHMIGLLTRRIGALIQLGR
jgi:hypothetical protein